MSALIDLLNSLKSDDTTNPTHFTFFPEEIRWTIPSQNLSELWRGYCDIVHNKTERVYLAEKPQCQMPIILDFNLQFNLSEISDRKMELTPDSFIIPIVHYTQLAMEDHLNMSGSDMEFICIVMVSESNLIEANTISRQFRFHFPFAKCEVETQSQYIRPGLIKYLRQYNIISKLTIQPTNDWDSIIDPGFIHRPIPLYHSLKSPNRPLLNIEHLLPRITPENIVKDDVPILELETTFNPFNHEHVQKGIIPSSMFIPENKNSDAEEYTESYIDGTPKRKHIDTYFWLPMFLSIYYWPGITEAKPGHDVGTGIVQIVSPKAPTPAPLAITQEDDILDLARSFLDMVKINRIENRNYWIDIGKALFNIDDGGTRGLDEWIRFTERSSCRSPEECRPLYETFSNNNLLTIKTLAWYAMKDDPDAYGEWHHEWVKPFISKASSCLHSDVAEALYRYYWLDFTCASLKQSDWYQYKNHRWNNLDSGITLRQSLSSDFLKQFEEYRTSLSQQVSQSNDDAIKQTLEIQIKKLATLIQNLKRVNFKQNIMREAMEHFYNEKFNRSLNANDSIIGMVNCVIEICDGHAIPRDGKPEDYISMCTGIPYCFEFDWDTPVIKRIMKYFDQVFPDKDLRRYFLKFAGSCLRGRNSDKCFPIWTGEGNNSKSILVKLFESAFGVYCIKFPTSLFTGKRTASSSAMPELARSKSTRVAFAQEPDEDEAFRSGVIKEMTGGDTFFARMLHDNGAEVEAMFKVVMMCNKIPPIPNGGKAMKNRIRIYPFLATWVDVAPLDEDEQYRSRTFKKDPFFEKQIPELARAFMWVMVEYFHIYIEEGLTQPQIITDHTEAYWKENDIYQNYIGERLIAARLENGESDSKCTLLHSEVYRDFKNWYKDSYPGAKVPDTSTAKCEFIARLGKLTKSRWLGVRFVSVDNGANLVIE
jgi:hypothetical protein